MMEVSPRSLGAGPLLRPARVAAGPHGDGGVPHGDAGPDRLRDAGTGLALRLGRVALRLSGLSPLQPPGAARAPLPAGDSRGDPWDSRGDGAAAPARLLVLPRDLGEGAQTARGLLPPFLGREAAGLVPVLLFQLLFGLKSKGGKKPPI